MWWLRSTSVNIVEKHSNLEKEHDEKKCEAKHRKILRRRQETKIIEIIKEAKKHKVLKYALEIDDRDSAREIAIMLISEYDEDFLFDSWTDSMKSEIVDRIYNAIKYKKIRRSI